MPRHYISVCTVDKVALNRFRPLQKVWDNIYLRLFECLLVQGTQARIGFFGKHRGTLNNRHPPGNRAMGVGNNTLVDRLEHHGRNQILLYAFCQVENHRKSQFHQKLDSLLDS